MKIDKKFIIRFSIYLLGLILVGVGVQVIIYTNLGSAPLDAFTWYLSRIYLQLFPNATLSHESIMGIASFIFGTITILILYLITKEKKLIFTWFNSMAVSFIILLWGFLFSKFDPIADNLFLKILISFIGIFILSLGVFLVIVTGYPGGPPEEVMKLINTKTNNLFVAKLLTEGMYLVLAFLAMLISTVAIGKEPLQFTHISLFTVFTLVSTAALISLFDKLYKIIFKKVNEPVNEWVSTLWWINF